MINEEFSNTELTQFVRVHNAAIARHEQTVEQHEIRMTRIEAILEATAAQQQLNAELLNRFEAGMLDLRDQVANFIQSREQN
ncbi:MAG: hypothetical protein WCA35_12150 [Kovacikia sp.]